MSPSRKNDVPVPEKRCPRRGKTTSPSFIKNLPTYLSLNLLFQFIFLFRVDEDVNHPVVWVDQDVNDPEQKMIDDKCG